MLSDIVVSCILSILSLGYIPVWYIYDISISSKIVTFELNSINQLLVKVMVHLGIRFLVVLLNGYSTDIWYMKYLRGN